MKSLFLSSVSNNTHSWVLLQRKIRDQGSNFNHETAKLATGGAFSFQQKRLIQYVYKKILYHFFIVKVILAMKG